jgi:hypothetical protein
MDPFSPMRRSQARNTHTHTQNLTSLTQERISASRSLELPYPNLASSLKLLSAAYTTFTKLPSLHFFCRETPSMLLFHLREESKKERKKERRKERRKERKKARKKERKKERKKRENHRCFAGIYASSAL